MAKLLKLRRGTTSQHSSFTGAEGEVTIDTDKEVPVVHDGSTAGGHPVAAEDMANVSSASITGRLASGSIAGAKIANGAITSAHIAADTVVAADIADNAIGSAEIADDAVVGSKIAANALDSEHYTDGSIDTEHFAAGAVATTSIAANAVTTAKIANDAVTDAKIAANTITNQAFADDCITAAELDDGCVGTAALANDAVTFAKIENVAADRILGRANGAGTGNTTELTAAEVRTIIGVESGATADQTAAEILTAIKTVDGDGSGLDADSVDGIGSSSFVRSDADDTISGHTEWQDNKEARFGNDNDLAIFSDNSNNFITANSNTLKFCMNGNNVRFQIEQDGDIWAKGPIIPWTNNTYALGTDANRWSNIYTNDLNLSNEGSANDVDGTWGSFTIQEGENDLFLLNKRNGKKYKFNLTEIS